MYKLYDWKITAKLQITSISNGLQGYLRRITMRKNHHEGICNYASYQITTCKVEGTNIMIKTLRRRNYGIPDDVYLFLKVMDESRW